MGTEPPLIIFTRPAAVRGLVGTVRAATRLSSDRAVEPSSGSNVIPRRARPGLAGPRPHTFQVKALTPCMVLPLRSAAVRSLLAEGLGIQPRVG